MESQSKQRPNVVKFLPHWRRFLMERGPEITKRYLKSGKYTHISRKDAFAILTELGLS